MTDSNQEQQTPGLARQLSTPDTTAIDAAKTISDESERKLWLGMIWAQTPQGVIGKDGGMPWSVPADMKHFQRTTMGQPTIMGRKTWQTLGCRPLPGRHAIVLSRHPQPDITGATVVDSPEAAIRTAAKLAAAADGVSALEAIPRLAHKAVSAWVIGGGQIYRLLMPYADELRVSLLDLEVDTTAATLAPEIDKQEFAPHPTLYETEWRQQSGDARWLTQVWLRKNQ